MKDPVELPMHFIEQLEEAIKFHESDTIAVFIS